MFCHIFNSFIPIINIIIFCWFLASVFVFEKNVIFFFLLCRIFLSSWTKITFYNFDSFLAPKNDQKIYKKSSINFLINFFFFTKKALLQFFIACSEHSYSNQKSPSAVAGCSSSIPSAKNVSDNTPGSGLKLTNSPNYVSPSGQKYK